MPGDGRSYLERRAAAERPRGKTGPVPMPAARKRSKQLATMVTPGDHEIIEALAKANHQPVSQWIYDAIQTKLKGTRGRQ